MSNYYVDKNGKAKKKKKKEAGTHYYVDKKGKITKEVVDAPIKGGNKNSWFKSGGFSDGVDGVGDFLGDLGETIVGTVGDVGVGIGKGITRMAEGIGDATRYGIAGVADLTGHDNYAKRLRKSATENDTDKIWGKAEKKVDEGSILGNKSDSVTEALGQIGSIILTGGVAGGLGASSTVATGLTMGSIGLSGTGSGISQAYQSGATDKQAYTYGAIAGTAEALTEMLFGGMGKTVKAVGLSRGLSSADDMLAKKVSSLFTNQISKNFAEYGIKASAEGVEEVLAGLAQSVGKKLTYMEDRELKDIVKDENLLEQFIVGTVASGIAQSAVVPVMSQGSLIESNKQGRDFITGLTVNEQKVVDKEVENRITEAEKDGKVLSNKEISKIHDEVLNDLEKGYISIDTIESALGDETYNTYKNMEEQENSIREEIESLENTPENQFTIKQRERLTELRDKLKTIERAGLKNKVREQLSNEVSELAKDSRLSESYNEKSRRSQAFEADLSKYDENQQETIQRAIDSGILNNTNRTHEFVDMVAKISADKGVLFDFTNNQKLKESGFAVEGKTVNGYVKDGNIALNIDSNKSLNTVVGHEITHVLEGTELYTELQKAVKQYAETKGEYFKRRDELARLYRNVDNVNLGNEVTADLVGDYLFTDKDFINNLSVEQPNIFKKIYDEIKYLCKMVTAGSKEARQLEKVKRAFEKAYKQTASTNSDTKHSFSGTRAKTANKSLLHEAEHMLDTGVDSETVRQETGWFKGYDGKMRFEIDDSQMKVYPNGDSEFRKAHPEYAELQDLKEKQSKSEITEEELNRLNILDSVLRNETNRFKELLRRGHLKLKNILEHDKLYASYPELKDVDIKIASAEDSGSILGGYNPRNFSIIINEKMLDGDVSELNKTLIHEIQHAIQDIENFTSGSSIEYWQDKLDDGDLIKTNKQNAELQKLKKEYSDISKSEPEFFKEMNELEKMTPTVDRGAYDFETFEQIEEDPIEWQNFDKQRDLLSEKYGEDKVFDFMDLQYNIKELEKKGITASDAYYKTAGEIEARDTASRLSLNEEQRKATRPSIDREDVVFSDNAKYSLSDSDGKELTKEQQEYFKDSKVRDENGNLKVMYHGTSNGGHTVFDTYGSNFGLFGQGSYFTDNKSVAESYTDKGKGNNKQVYEAYLNIKNPMDMDAQANVEEWQKAFPEADFSSSKTNEDCFKAMKEYFFDNEYTKYEAYEEAWDAITGMGYDGLTHIGGGRFNKADDTRHRVYIAYEPEQIKNIDNTKPTSDADIRYSLSEDKKIYDYQSTRPKVRGGWTIQKIQKQLKTESSGGSAGQEFIEFDSVEEIMDNIFYHGSTSLHKRLKAGSTIKGTYRTGGYGEEYHSISLSKSKNVASNFTGMSRSGVVTPILLRKGANVIEMPEIQDSMELEEILPQLWEQKVDAVKIGNWDKEFSEQELVVLNPKAITVIDKGAHYFNVYQKPRFENLNLEEVADLMNQHKERLLEGKKTSIEKIKNRESYYKDLTDEQQQQSIKNIESSIQTIEDKYNNLLNSEKFSMSYKGQNIAPYGNYNVYGKDIELQQAPVEEVAPVRETTPVQQNTQAIDYAPLTEEQANERDAEQSLTSMESEEFERVVQSYMDDAPAFMLDDAEIRAWAEEQARQNPQGPNTTENTVTPESPLEERDIYTIGRERKTNAYMYENPEVKPFFQQEAQVMLWELQNSQKGERGKQGSRYGIDDYGIASDEGWYGTKRQTSEALAYLRDNFKYDTDDLTKGLKAIIEDHGAENNAISKRIEFMIDERLREGYKDFMSNERMPANQDYINLLNEKQITEYNDEAFSNWVQTLKDEDIPPVQETIPPIQEDIAPIQEGYEAIEPEPQKLEGEEEQWARNKMQRADKPPREDGLKERRWAETSTESSVVDRRILPKDLDQNAITYQPISNKKTLNNANAMLDRDGYDASVEYFNNQFKNKRVSLDDIALGERLIQEAVKKGDMATAGELIQNVSILGTELGQKVQALSIIQRLTPEGQLKMLNKIVERGKAKGDKAFEDVEITQDMIDHILKTYGKDGTYNQEDLNKAVEDVKQQIADQMKVTMMDKVNAWRYLSMLGNVKTHGRNIISNVGMRGTMAVKDALARTIETIAPIKNRTKTWKLASADVKEFAKQTTKEMEAILADGSKYSETGDIKAKRQIFKNKILNSVYEFNSNMLTKEDWWFQSSAFNKAFRDYLTANGIRTNEDIQNNAELIEKAKAYATEQSQIATFKQYSFIANKLREIEKKNTATEIAVGAIVPFKNTPINIAKTGLNYSPLGFAKTLTYDVSQVKNGNMEASEMIDHLSQNITGTGLALLGYALAMSGFLNGAGKEDKEGKYDYQLGKQAYSVNIGGKTYSLSWLTPMAMPLFVGANAFEILTEGKEWDGNVVIEALTQTLDPMSEMSVLSGLTNVLSSYEKGSGIWADIAQTTGQNYVTQFVPTLSSQVATFMDDKQRSTKVAGNSDFKFLEETVNKLKLKIPGLRETLEPSTDVWGREVKLNENKTEKAFETFIAPYSRKENIATEIDKELKDLYGDTGDAGLFPQTPKNSVNYDGEKYDMSAKEYTSFKKTYGQNALELMEELFRTTTYQEANATDKAEMVDKVYDYASDEAKREYLAKQDIEYTNATKKGKAYYKENNIKGAIENDMPLDEFDFYNKYPKKYKFLQKNNVSYDEYTKDKKTREAYNWAYENPEKYTLSKAVSNDIVTYKSYTKKLSKIKSDKDKYGKSITGSRKQKVADYINGLDADYGERLILFKSEYNADDTYNYEIIDYLNNREDITFDEMNTILKELGFTVTADGDIYWK